jgi:hypothetical protein
VFAIKTMKLVMTNADAKRKIRKIRHCFFSANQAKIANCVSVSAATQHIEAPNNANNTHPNNQSRFCCQD